MNNNSLQLDECQKAGDFPAKMQISTNNAYSVCSFGIDKVALHFHGEDFYLVDSTGWRAKPDTKTRPLIIDVCGNVVRARSLHKTIGGSSRKTKNLKRRIEDFSWNPPMGIVSLTITRQKASVYPCLRVEFSLPYIINEISNFPLVEHTKLKEALRWIEAMTKLAGVKANFRHALVSRLELCCDLQMSEGTSAYQKFLRPSRMTRVTQSKWDKCEIYRNKSGESIMYDKLAEAKAHNHDYGHIHPCTLRIERKLFGTTKVKNVMGGKSLQDLQNGFDKLENHFKEVMLKMLKLEIDESLDFRSVTHDEELLTLIYGKRAAKKQLRLMNLARELDSDFDAEDEYWEELRAERCLESKINTKRRELERGRLNSLLCQRSESTEKLFAELYIELRTKIANLSIGEEHI